MLSHLFIFSPLKKSPANCTQSIRPIHRQTTPRVDAVNRGRCGPLRSSKRTQQRDTRRECRNNFLQKKSMIENHGSKLLTKNFQQEKTPQTSNKTSEKLNLNDSKSLKTQFAASVYLLSISNQKKALEGP